MKSNHLQRKNTTEIVNYMQSPNINQSKAQLTRVTHPDPCRTGSNTVTKIYQLESIDLLKSKTEMGYEFFVKNTNGSQCSLKCLWDDNDNKPKQLPAISSTLLIEHKLPQVINRKERALLSITNWHSVKSKYSITYLQSLFNQVENPGHLIGLLDLIDRLNDSRLQQLLIDLFRKPNIALPFISLPASHNHHHSCASGLLQHSLECAQWVESLAYETLTPIEAELTIVTALLHDLGKVETMTQSDSSQLVSHEVMGLLLIEPLLSQLQTQWKQGANVLRQMLSTPAQSKQFPRLPGQLLVKMADQYSTSLSARAMAFAGQPDYYYWASLKTPTSIQFFNRIS